MTRANNPNICSTNQNQHQRSQDLKLFALGLILGLCPALIQPVSVWAPIFSLLSSMPRYLGCGVIPWTL